MAKHTRREVGLIAELLADKLIATYQHEQIPLMVENFAAAGFTQADLRRDAESLYQMLVIAAYDHRPYSGAAGGYEVIWGIRCRVGSIREAMDELGLFTREAVLALDRRELAQRLEAETYHGQSLATDGGRVEFATTLQDLARLVDASFHRELTQAEGTADVVSLYRSLTGVHGIGDTIAAKVVKYLLREIDVGRVPPGCFPLSVVWPITQEYHAAEAGGKLSARVDPTLTPLVMGLLLKAEEPFAIDALFYLQRYRDRELDDFIDELRMIQVPKSKIRELTHPGEPDKVDAELAQRLLVVIQEILDAARSVTEAEVRGADLGGAVKARRIQGSAQWLYNEMAKLAEDGQAGEMLAFYENCLQSPKGRDVGWALGMLGRKSMESEADRFRRIYETGAAVRSAQAG